MTEHFKTWIDWGAVGLAVTTFMGWLPALAALASLLWTSTRLYEYFKEKYSGNKRHDDLES